MYFKASVDSEEGVQIESAATIPELCTAIIIIVGELYKHMNDKDTKGAFKFVLQHSFAEGIPFKTAEKIKAKNNEKMGELSNEILEFLKGLSKKDD